MFWFHVQDVSFLDHDVMSIPCNIMSIPCNIWNISRKTKFFKIENATLGKHQLNYLQHAFVVVSTIFVVFSFYRFQLHSATFSRTNTMEIVLFANIYVSKATYLLKMFWFHAEDDSFLDYDIWALGRRDGSGVCSDSNIPGKSKLMTSRTFFFGSTYNFVTWFPSGHYCDVCRGWYSVYYGF